MSIISIKQRLIDPELLLTAYCNGFFPMAEPQTGEIRWYSPNPRCIFELDEFHVPRSLKQLIKKRNYEIKIDKAFRDVIEGCANRTETWISDVIINSYIELYKLGFAHSVEVWINNELAGGLYGVAIKGAFFGESMFTKVKNASKIALVHLVNRLKERGYLLLDTQFITPHLAMFGAKEIPRQEYLKRLKEAMNINCSFI